MKNKRFSTPELREARKGFAENVATIFDHFRDNPGLYKHSRAAHMLVELESRLSQQGVVDFLAENVYRTDHPRETFNSSEVEALRIADRALSQGTKLPVSRRIGLSGVWNSMGGSSELRAGITKILTSVDNALDRYKQMEDVLPPPPRTTNPHKNAQKVSMRGLPPSDSVVQKAIEGASDADQAHTLVERLMAARDTREGPQRF